jgi:hypothetical protein
MVVETDAAISFAHKVSSQEDHDYLRFLVDNNVIDQWSGNQDWAVDTYQVTAGTHTFKWTYAKDSASSANSDHAWIDDIAFPTPPADSVAIAGLSDTSLAFGEVGTGYASALPLTVTNYGNRTLTGSIASIPGFSVDLAGRTREAGKAVKNRDVAFTLETGQSVTYNVTFAPTEQTPYSGTLIVASNDSAYPSLQIPVAGTGIVGNQDGSQVPLVTKLSGNYPNPFNPVTEIRFSLANPTSVSLRVFDLRGRMVKELFANEALSAGDHRVTWNGTDNNNQPVGSGIYFYEMRGGKYTSTKKMILLK